MRLPERSKVEAWLSQQGQASALRSRPVSVELINKTYTLSSMHLELSSSRLRIPVTYVADILGKLWASPYTLLGLTYGLVGHLLSLSLGIPARVCMGNNAIQFMNNRGIIPGAALTLGNVILYGTGADPACGCAYGDARVNLGRHEQAHTRQYQLLGPLFLPVYLLCSLRGLRRNPLERAAQHYGAGQSEWWFG